MRKTKSQTREMGALVVKVLYQNKNLVKLWSLFCKNALLYNVDIISGSHLTPGGLACIQFYHPFSQALNWMTSHLS
jgi:hypothetical protein